MMKGGWDARPLEKKKDKDKGTEWGVRGSGQRRKRNAQHIGRLKRMFHGGGVTGNSANVTE
jgi:hypothetical protein